LVLTALRIGGRGEHTLQKQYKRARAAF